VAVHDDDLRRPCSLGSADGRVDLLRVELAALLVHRVAARDLGPLDDAGDPLHVADHVDAHRGRHRTIRPVTAAIRIGTCSWADEALVKHWYPRGMRSAEERLRYYAERFSTVEVDSTYYRLPEPEMTARWAERTPPGFVFHVKAFGMMTRHPVRLEQLPPDLRELADVDERGRVERPPRELRAEVFQRFTARLVTAVPPRYAAEIAPDYSGEIQPPKPRP